MGDQQRIYPVQEPDIEAPQAPLVSRNSSKSEKPESPLRAARSNSRPPRAPRSNSSSVGGYQPFRREIPVHHSKPPKRRRSCCCRLFCWTLSILLLLTIAIAISLGVLYLVFQPKLPKYTIDRMQITQFNLQNNMSLHATFNVNITAENPNKKIGIFYEDESHVTVWYTDTQLCEGVLPVFYQGHRSTTVFDLTLTGIKENATDILTALQAQQQTGTIPLKMKAKVPIRIKVGKLKLFEVKFRVKCNLVVDSLAENNSIKINNSSCKFRLRI